MHYTATLKNIVIGKKFSVRNEVKQYFENKTSKDIKCLRYKLKNNIPKKQPQADQTIVKTRLP